MPAPPPIPAGPPATDATPGGSHAGRALKWERRKDERPGELLVAALDMFAERGYAATRLDDVARAAGVSKGTLYLYYANKEDLFKAVVRSTIVAWLDDYRRSLDDGSSCETLLVGYLEGLWRHVVDSRLAAILKLVVAEASNFPEVARFFHEEVVEPHTRLLGTILQRGIDAGTFRPIDVTSAVFLWISPPVLKAIWKNSFDPVCEASLVADPAQLARTQAAMVLEALKPVPAGRASACGEDSAAAAPHRKEPHA